jgi:LmbE family N-acetylglucosaminyl deacetylase
MNVLVIAAHMDDEVLGVGGTIARHAAAGDAVTICFCCQRAYQHRFPPRRRQEDEAAARRAAAILGCRRVRFLRLPDERLDERLLSVIVPLEACVEEVRPSVVYTTHRGDTNQDHRAVFQATMVACRTIATPKVPRLLCYEVLSSTEQAPPFPESAFQPNVYVNIRATLPKKLRAMRAYRRELRPFPHPRSLKGIEVLAQKRGMEAGFDAAEAFMLIRDQWE